MNLAVFIWYWLAFAMLALWGASQYWRLHNWIREKADLKLAVFCLSMALIFFTIGHFSHSPKIWWGIGCSVWAQTIGQC